MESTVKILVVDDNEICLDIFREALSDSYKVYTAKSGEEALILLPSISPDLVILDINMPGIDGYFTCQKIRSKSLHDNIKIVMVTAKAQWEDQRRGMEVGADEYLTKPFETDQLLKIVRYYTSDSLKKE